MEYILKIYKTNEKINSYLSNKRYPRYSHYLNSVNLVYFGGLTPIRLIIQSELKLLSYNALHRLITAKLIQRLK